MKTGPAKKLVVRRETLRAISARDLSGVVGGTALQAVEGPRIPENGFIMKDTIIVKTSTR